MIRALLLGAAIAVSLIAAPQARAAGEEAALAQIAKAEAAKQRPVMVFLRSGPIVSGTLAGVSADGSVLTMKNARYYAASATPQRGDSPLFDSLDIRMSEVAAIGHGD
ncbi:MAG TPA: hypothetical protein VMU06_20180 [Stellaceae bacterium]|nr:hypothetical protein [Stellaceae bacterium]